MIYACSVGDLYQIRRIDGVLSALFYVICVFVMKIIIIRQFTYG